MKLLSGEFSHMGKIPSKFTCEGDDVNPALRIEDIPHGAKNLALTLTDPDSKYGLWTHWVMYDIPVAGRIDENSAPGTCGINDFKKIGYGGPCPASGTHRYVFRLYALDTPLGLEEGVSLRELEKAMAGHVLERAELTGLYRRASADD